VVGGSLRQGADAIEGLHFEEEEGGSTSYVAEQGETSAGVVE